MNIMGRAVFVLILIMAFAGCGKAEAMTQGKKDAQENLLMQMKDAALDGTNTPKVPPILTEPLILTEPPALTVGTSESSIEAMKDVTLSGSGGTFTLSVPESWECVGLLQTEKDSSYEIRIRPETGMSGYISVFYDSCFGVCGTGLEERETELAGDKAIAGYYDGHADWDFIIFKGKNEKIVALNQAWDWCAEYRDEIMAVLQTLRYEPDVISENARTAYQGNTAFGVYLCPREITRTKADLYFRRHQGDPEQTIYYGEDFMLSVYAEENREWIPVNDLSPTPAFKAVAYNLPYDEIVEITIDWKDIYGELQPGLYVLSKTVVDGDYNPDYDGLQSVDLRVFFRIY